jgi:hypothetical protein
LPEDFSPPSKLPLTEGQVHFIRQVSQDGKVMILNLNWGMVHR